MEGPGLNHTCPHCGAALHERASFCPHCAETINRRTEPKPPRPMRQNVLRAAVALLVVVGVALGLYLHFRPRVYDGLGEVIYTDADGTYQLVLAWPGNRYEPAYKIGQTAVLNDTYRYPSRLYINHVDSGADAGKLFLQKVERVTTEIIQPDDSLIQMTATEPAPHSYSPDAAMVTFLDFTGQDGSAQLLWTLYLKNGDVIRLRQDQTIKLIPTYDYDATVAPLSTVEELQALIDEIAETVEPEAVVNIHLPNVTYEGDLVMEQRPINLYGSADGGKRTTFTGSIRAAPQNTAVIYIQNIDFRGPGDGVGISAPARVWVEDCYFTGWKTAVLSYGYAWVNTIGCTFEENEVGFHFNSTGASATHSMFNDNQFRRNGTAVILENVPTELTLNFYHSLFSENGKDIDNLCGHSIDISNAIFQ